MKNKRKLFVSILAGIMAAVLIFGLAAMIIPAQGASLSALKQQLNDLKTQKSEIEADISNLQSQLNANLEEIEDVVEQKNTIDQEIFLLHEKITNINEQINTYGILISDKQTELEAAEARLAELNQKNKTRIRAMEEQGKLSYWSVLFKANDFIDLLDRINMINEIAASDSRRLKDMSEAAEAVSTAKAELEEEMSGLAETKAELKLTQESMEAKAEEAEKLLADLIATGEEYDALLDAAEEEAVKLGQDIAKTQNAYNNAQYEQWLSTSKPASSGGSSSSSGSVNDGTSNAPSSSGWIVPCKYTKFTSPYGYRIHPIYGYKKFHYGVDLAGPKGTPIKAARAGTVVAATYNSSAGYYVQINHGDGFQSKYLHMTHYIVKNGQYVTQGQVIGYMGSTGASTGSHLHFGILYNGSYVNPAKYINI